MSSEGSGKPPSSPSSPSLPSSPPSPPSPEEAGSQSAALEATQPASVEEISQKAPPEAIPEAIEPPAIEADPQKAAFEATQPASVEEIPEKAPPEAIEPPAIEASPPPPPPPTEGDATPPDATPAPPKKKGRAIVWLKRIGVALGVLLVAAAIGVVLVIRHYEAKLPPTAELKRYDPPQVTRVLARDGTVLGEVFVERRTVMKFDNIPVPVRLAALAAEDASFYEHAGLSYFGMLRALVVNLRSMRVRQGAGTITQQVVRNVLLTQERTFERKMREILLAKKIEDELSKDDILELYLNHVYWGHGRYGVEEASKFYFGKSVRDVSLAEAALLAGILKGPNLYSPRVDMARAKQRQTYVLEQMRAKGFARPDQVDGALKEPILLAPEPESLPELAPEAVSEAKRVLRELVGPAADRGGYTVVTTIDPAAQAAARAAVRKNLDDYAARHKLLAPITKGKGKKEPAGFSGTPTTRGVYEGVVVGADDALGTISVQVGTVTGTVDVRTAARYNPKGLPASKLIEVGKVVRVSLLEPPSDPAGEVRVEETAVPGTGDEAAKPAPPTKMRLELGPQGALVAIDVRSREIIALVGSYEAVRAGLDRSRSHRQPGSTFKTFVYSYGINAKTLTPATILETDPEKLGTSYKPANYDESEGKTPARLREALAHSVNVAAVAAMQRVGPQSVVAFSKQLGIESKLGADLSLALGSYEVTPREMAGAYAAFAAGGEFEEPALIQKITGPNGVSIELKPRAPRRRVMDEAAGFVVTSVLTQVVKSGTGKKALSLGRPIAGKTGTSNKSKDTWFVGYSTDIACAVWTGFDDAVSLGAGETGAVAALPAFVEFMREAHRKRPVADFPVPAGVVRATIDPATGLLARPEQEDAIEEVFVAGTEPTEVAPDPDDPYADIPSSPDVKDAKDAKDGGPVTPPFEAPAQPVIPPAGDPPPF
jgi:penicillin-binding protein 1A